MQQIIIHQVEKYLGPKVAALVASGLTVFTQVQSEMSALATAGVETSWVDVVSTALTSGDLAAILPAPLVAFATFFFRKARYNGPMARAHTGVTSGTPVNVDIDFDAPPFKDDTSDTVDTKAMGIALGDTQDKVATMEGNIASLVETAEHLMKKTSDTATTVTRLTNIYKVDQNTTTNTISELWDRVEKVEEITDPLGDNVKVVNPVPRPEDDSVYFGNKDYPRNLRNNNPLNIEATVGNRTKWKGEVEPDGRYARYETPEHGIRAGLYLLRKAYFTRHKLQTVHSIIHRWAPLGDNSDASVANYIAHCCNALDVTPKDSLRIDKDDEQLLVLYKAMAEFEGGTPLPYTDDTFYKAIKLI